MLFSSKFNVCVYMVYILIEFVYSVCVCTCRYVCITVLPLFDTFG